MSEVLSHAFRSVFSEDRIEELADPLSWELGDRFASNGQVGPLTVTRSSVQATVPGKPSRKVRLWLDDNQPAFDCSCPVGQKGRLCKHAVAVALIAAYDPGEQERMKWFDQRNW